MMAVVLSGPAAADTLLGALAAAYQTNPQLNSQRAIVRQTDEGVPQALSGYRPRVSATANAGEQFTWSKGPGGDSVRSYTQPRSIGATAQQTLFNGFQTATGFRYPYFCPCPPNSMTAQHQL
jgi:outer membrane protein